MTLIIPAPNEKKYQDKVKSLAIFVGFVVYSSRIAIKIADFKKAVAREENA